MKQRRWMKASVLVLILALLISFAAPTFAQSDVVRIMPLGIRPVEEALARYCMDTDRNGEFVDNHFEAFLETEGPDEAAELLIGVGLADEDTAFAFVEEIDAALTLPTLDESADAFYTTILTYCYGEEIWTAIPTEEVTYEYWVEYFGWTEAETAWFVYYYELTFSEYYTYLWLVEQGLTDEQISDLFYFWTIEEDLDALSGLLDELEITLEELEEQIAIAEEAAEFAELDDEFEETMDEDGDGEIDAGEDEEGDEDTDGEEDAGDEDTSEEDAGEEDTGDEDTGDEDAGEEDTGDEDTGDEDTGDEDTGDEDAGDEDTGEEDAGDEDAGDEE